MIKPRRLGEDDCPRCWKPRRWCFCAEIAAAPARLEVLILQHPQEPDKELGTARLLNLALANSRLEIGLSWANLRSALGRAADPRCWAVLHLGSGVKPASGGDDAAGDAGPSSGKPKATPLRASAALRPEQVLVLLDRKSRPIADQAAAIAGLEGLIVLDGTWSQAKTLWWRNPWMLKCRRGVLRPRQPSLYGSLRREPRRECLSTLEAAALALESLGEPRESCERLRGLLRRLIGLRRERPNSNAAAAPTALGPELPEDPERK